MSETLHPPLISCGSMVIPLVKRIAPQLSGCRKCIGWAASHCNRCAVFVELEELRVSPCISGIEGHVNRNIPDNAYALLISVCLERSPLNSKHILLELIEENLLSKFLAVLLHCCALSELDILIPLNPAHIALGSLHCHIECIVIKPGSVILYKLLKVCVLLNIAVLECSAKHLET